ncbi:Ig-like domain-containing protein [Longimicrobium sp.]|uniref:Ig-like domain-containing protein n=1 Tax=Longimicrobium sp. TaxID=2029185 RepID=UPI003B3B839B
MSRRLRSCTLALLAAAFAAACDGPAGSETLRSVAISPDTAYITLNTTSRLEAVARGSGGGTMTGVAFAWASSDTSVAAVSSDGTVTARRFGVATITASAEGAAGQARVWVTGGPGVTVVTEVRDTVDAVAGTPLVAELRDAGGRPLADQPLRFEAVAIAHFTYAAQLQNPAGGRAIETRVVFTDAQGRASVPVVMGTVAGPARFIVRNEGLGLADTTTVTVLAGAPAGARVEPADTAVFIGRTVQLRATALDRHGNPTAAAVALTRMEGPLPVDGNGVVSTPAYGTSLILATAGGRADTARIASVPVGAMATSTNGGLVLMNLDGTGRIAAGAGAFPAWSPDGQNLVFVDEGYLQVANGTGGAARPLVSVSTGGEHFWPQYSPDGAYVYYFSRVPNVRQTIWRVDADGTGLTKVAEGPGHPSLSPDGTKMVHFWESWPVTIRITDLTTGQTTGELAPGHAPTWSPTGELIAYNELNELGYLRGIMVMRPDGSGVRKLTAPTGHYGWSPRWSPDGRWIIATHFDNVTLIQVETGLVIELPWKMDTLQGVSWKPGALLP